MLLWQEQRGEFGHWQKFLILTLTFTNWVTTITLLDFSEPQFPQT